MSEQLDVKAMPAGVVLRTGLEVLRPPRAEDAEASLSMLHEPPVVLWNPAPAVVDIPSARDWCARGADWSSGTHATFTIVDAPSGRVVGNISLHAIDYVHLTGVIGYRIAGSASGRGVATRSLVAVTEWAYIRLGLMRLQLQHAVDNLASCRVAAKAGYHLEGTMRLATVYGDGRRRDDHLHARISTDVLPPPATPTT
jgi:RimJ/RimL family protein N-acetyltransferase